MKRVVKRRNHCPLGHGPKHCRSSDAVLAVVEEFALGHRFFTGGAQKDKLSRSDGLTDIKINARHG
jgi:hypothetical protein